MKKHDNFSEWYNNIIGEAELVDLRYNVKGFIVIMPWAYKAIKNIYKFYEAELEKESHKPIHFPVVIPESNLKKEEEHIKGFEDEVFWISSAGKNQLEERLALRPTSETAMYPLFALWINGWKDLPLKLYQSGSVWRYDTKATRPFLRGREFLWIETHCAFAFKKDAYLQIDNDMNMAKRVLLEKLCIPFLKFKRPIWDKFAGADETFACDTLFPDGKALQIVTTHMLGQNFSKVFSIQFDNEKNEKEFVFQTCYGPGINRIFASLVAWNGDDKGIIYPFEVAPVQVIIIPIYKENKDKIDDYAEKIKNELEKRGISFTYDNEEGQTPGFKFNKWELKGVPFRIEVGERESESKTVVLALRDTKEKIVVEEKKIADAIILQAEKMRKRLMEKNIALFDSMIKEAKTMADLEKNIEKGGFIKVPFCSLEKEGIQCYKKIKEKTQGEIRGELLNDKKPKDEKCIVCGKKAMHHAYVARQY